MNKFISLLPPALQKNETVGDIAALLDNEIEAIDTLTDKLLIYANLGEQSEAVIDELARSFHILPDEGYRFADTIEKKRELVRQALTLHRHKGTLYAVKEVLKILGIKGEVLEWFRYGGRPYYFKIDTRLGSGITETDISILEKLLSEFKNIRSHLEGITFRVVTTETQYYATAMLSGEIITVRPYIPLDMTIGGKVCYGATQIIHEKIEIKPKSGGEYAK